MCFTVKRVHGIGNACETTYTRAKSYNYSIMVFKLFYTKPILDETNALFLQNHIVAMNIFKAKSQVLDNNINNSNSYSILF